LGNIEFHYFSGYSGGTKAIMPGVSSSEAIRINHANMAKQGSVAGNLKSNPVRQDIDETLRFLPVDFILNVVLDEQKRIVCAVAGDAVAAHAKGCAFLDAMYKIPIKERADIVIASSGGFPKDINLYQAQKALENAKYAVKPDGIIIWCAYAKEGFGNDVFEEWMQKMTIGEMTERIHEQFILGGHKAAAIAAILETATIYLVSDIPSKTFRTDRIVCFRQLQEAVDDAILKTNRLAKILVMPAAGSTLPVLCKKV
jgi:nickel-dependent lactate racemase